jgi:hypothetical protein
VTEQEFGSIFLGRLKEYYGYAPKDEGLLIYVNAFQDMDYRTVKAAADKAAMHCDRYPKVSEIMAQMGSAAPGTANASAYDQNKDNERLHWIPLDFIASYGFCTHKCDPCDGRGGSGATQYPKGVCGWNRWQVLESIDWLKRTQRAIPPNVLGWMKDQGLLAKEESA